MSQSSDNVLMICNVNDNSLKEMKLLHMYFIK